MKFSLRKILSCLAVVAVVLAPAAQAEGNVTWDELKEQAGDLANKSGQWAKEKTEKAKEWAENEGKDWALEKGKKAAEAVEKSAEAAKEWGKDVLDKAGKELEKHREQKPDKEPAPVVEGISA
ncbi:hypothetical protein ACWJJH_11990 [Endozoicomonadaceae bacterium StTr2]